MMDRMRGVYDDNRRPSHTPRETEVLKLSRSRETRDERASAERRPAPRGPESRELAGACVGGGGATSDNHTDNKLSLIHISEPTRPY